MKTWLAVLLILFSGKVFAQTFSDNNFTRKTIGDGWWMALGATFSADGEKLFVWEKRGQVIVCNKSGDTYTRQSMPVLSIQDEVLDWADNGLMGFALDPDFLNNGFIYLLYAVDRRFLMNDNSIQADAGFAATIGRVTRYKTIQSGSNLVADLSTRTILLGESPSTGIALVGETHGLGSLVFAQDGTLLVSAGDAAHFEDEDKGSEPATFYAQALSDGIIRDEENVGTFRAQLLNSHNGKLLRIDPSTGNGIPSNPFYNPSQPRSPKSRVWALGLRNPFRVAIKPGSGSSDPATGDIGEVYIGDVGYEAWEDFNIVTAPGQNFGWPIYEGLEVSTRFATPASTTQNRDEPNPFAGQSGCTRPYFTFRELIKDPAVDGNANLTNPCDPTKLIGSGSRFVHRRPALDYRHNQNVARVGVFNGNIPDVAVVGTPESGVVGTPFDGYCAVAGMWYTGDNFPASYKNKFFLADWASGWIKPLTIDYSDVVTKVENFASGFDEIVCMAQNPVDGRVVIVALWPHIMLVEYGGNQSPVAKPVINTNFGTSPLTVNFTGDQSFDPTPNGSIATYQWNFGGGSPATSSLANPSNIVFTEGSGNPRKFVVTLTVTDNGGASHTDSVIVSVNNTAPIVNITSPVRNSTYTPGTDTIYNCTATVFDAEHGPGQLKYEWQTTLRHNTHEHLGVIDNNVNTTTRITRVGCTGSDTYYWFVKLTVTDEAGLATVNTLELHPDCAVGPDNTPPTVTSVIPADGTTGIDATTIVAAIFDDAIDPSTVNGTTVELKDDNDNVIAASINVASNQIVLTPADALEPATLYTVALKSGPPGIEDLAGNVLAANFTWSFTTSAGPLPVLLHKFSVTQDGGVNLVKWTTEMESDMAYFELERSTNGSNFQPINRQAAANTAGTTNYSFADNNFSPGRNYYRLKMVEHGAIVQYSIIISTASDMENNGLKIMPNPVTGNFYVSYYASDEDNIAIEIKDISGRVLSTRKEHVNKGQNIIHIQSLPNWVAGVYFLSVQDKNGSQQLRFVKSY